jgi:hypothetical protein
VGSWTNSFANIQCYDTIKVDGILNQIHGKDHNGNPARVPNLFGMNFQAVSVGQKLIESGVGTGGYLDASGTPSCTSVKAYWSRMWARVVTRMRRPHRVMNC